MCILFVKVGPGGSEKGFKLILVSNRDEFFSRPAKVANFWSENEEIIGGRDMTENKEGGTWLAMTTKGKIGVVLNFSIALPVEPTKQSRGFLVTDYLTNTGPTVEHLQRLSAVADQFNKFHLVTIESRSAPVLRYYTNGDTSKTVKTITEGIFALGNSPLDKPYEKVKKGKTRFEEIVKKYNRMDAKDQLVNNLLQLLKWTEKHRDVDASARLPLQIADATSSIFVTAKDCTYGTRTHTIILVDSHNRADFYEWTLKEPIDPDNQEWIQTHLEFDLVLDNP